MHGNFCSKLKSSITLYCISIAVSKGSVIMSYRSLEEVVEDILSEDALSDEVLSDEDLLDDVLSDEVRSEELLVDDVRSEELRSVELLSVELLSVDVLSVEALSEDLLSDADESLSMLSFLEEVRTKVRVLAGAPAEAIEDDDDTELFLDLLLLEVFSESGCW